MRSHPNNDKAVVDMMAQEYIIQAPLDRVTFT